MRRFAQFLFQNKFALQRKNLASRLEFKKIMKRSLSPSLEPKFLGLALCIFSAWACCTHRPAKATPRLSRFQTTDTPCDKLGFVRKSCAPLPQFCFFLRRDQSVGDKRATLRKHRQSQHSTDNLESSADWPGGGLFKFSVPCLSVRAISSALSL